MRHLVRKLALAGLVAFACSGPTSPGEMPPLAPRPDPVQDVPAERKPKRTPTSPVPGAPDPLRPPIDAGPPVTEVPSPQFESSAQHLDESPADAGVQDATVQDALDLPAEVPDALPPDASKRPETTGFACC